MKSRLYLIGNEGSVQMLYDLLTNIRIAGQLPTYARYFNLGWILYYSKKAYAQNALKKVYQELKKRDTKVFLRKDRLIYEAAMTQLK